MSLDTAISLTTLDAILSYMRLNPEVDGLWVYCSQGDATAATCEITDTTMVLIITGGVQAGTNTLTFADADKDTLTELITAINALTGWEAGRIYNASADSTDLVVTGALSCLGSANEVTLKIKDNYLITELINRASDLINRYCNRTLKTTAYTLERYNGEGRKLFLENYPVTAITQICDGTIDAIRVRYTSTTAYNAYVEIDQGSEEIKLIHDGTTDATIDISSGNDELLSQVVTAINAVSGWEASISNTDYNSYPSSQLYTKFNRFALNQFIYLGIPDEPIDGFEVDYDNGTVDLPSEFSEGFQNIYVSYTAGYVTIPASLEQICIELVKFKYNLAKKDLTLKSETIGKVYKYELGDLSKALPDHLLAELDLFKKRLI